MTILARKSDRKPQPAEALFDAAPTVTAPADRHFFVPDEHGTYCLACNLPARNRRHVSKAA